VFFGGGGFFFGVTGFSFLFFCHPPHKIPGPLGWCPREAAVVTAEGDKQTSASNKIFTEVPILRNSGGRRGGGMLEGSRV